MTLVGNVTFLNQCPALAAADVEARKKLRLLFSARGCLACLPSVVTKCRSIDSNLCGACACMCFRNSNVVTHCTGTRRRRTIAGLPKRRLRLEPRRPHQALAKESARQQGIHLPDLPPLLECNLSNVLSSDALRLCTLFRQRMPCASALPFVSACPAPLHLLRAGLQLAKWNGQGARG